MQGPVGSRRTEFQAQIRPMASKRIRSLNTHALESLSPIFIHFIFLRSQTWGGFKPPPGCQVEKGSGISTQTCLLRRHCYRHLFKKRQTGIWAKGLAAKQQTHSRSVGAVCGRVARKYLLYHHRRDCLFFLPRNVLCLSLDQHSYIYVHAESRILHGRSNVVPLTLPLSILAVRAPNWIWKTADS